MAPDTIPARWDTETSAALQRRRAETGSSVSWMVDQAIQWAAANDSDLTTYLAPLDRSTGHTRTSITISSEAAAQLSVLAERHTRPGNRPCSRYAVARAAVRLWLNTYPGAPFGLDAEHNEGLAPAVVNG